MTACMPWAVPYSSWPICQAPLGESLVWASTPPDPRHGFGPSLATMAHLAHLWMGIVCPRPEGHDPVLTKMGIETAAGEPWPTPRYWTAHTWAAGMAVAHNATHRIVCRAADKSIWWSIAGRLVLHGSATNGTHCGHLLDSARTDDRVFSALLDGLQVRFEGRRLTVSGGPMIERQRWHFSEGTTFQRTAKGFCAANEYGTFEIVASQDWSIGENCLIGPPKEGRHRLRFEHRPS